MAARAAFRQEMQEVPPEKLVFLDEAGATTTMTRTYARASQGERVVDAVPQGKWQVTTMIGAMRMSGSCAGLVFEGATDTAAFMAFLKNCLTPRLKKGDVVIMDNLSCHKSPRVEAAITAAGARLRYLPPYSPDFNPIEKMWSKVKSSLRSAAKRTRRTLWNAIGTAMRSITPQDCKGYFSACGLVAT